MDRVHEHVGRKDRHAVEVDAVVHRTDGSKSPAKLTNFSDDGCRIEADAVISNAHADGVKVALNSDDRLLCAGMLDEVIERFLRDTV